MSVTRTFTVTVANPGVGNRYYIDGVLQETVNLIEGNTYRFDQSAGSNGGHPFKFSTTSNGTHNGGSEYTTGVTINGTPGQAGSYTEIAVAIGAPQLYYYCQYHSGMGGQANTVDSSVIRVLTVTVANPGAGNRYYIDGVLQETVNLAEGGTYRFDQSAGSNGGHPFKFSTTSNGTHSGGSEYTTGVTYNGTPGNPGAYTQIAVAVPAPQLYYYCQYHSGMGGQANTVDTNTYGMWAWGTDAWGDQGPVEITLSGQSATSSVGSVTTFDIQTVIPTGVEAETDLGSLTTTQLTNVALTGLQAQTELGTFDNAGTLVGWGRSGWGEEPYGDSFNSLVQPAGLSTTSSVGSVTAFDTTSVTLTGVSSTSAVGSLDPIISPVVIPTGLSLTSNVGVPLVTQASVGLTGLGMTSTVGGIILDALIVQLDGLSTTSTIGSVQEQITQTLTGVSATSSVGALVPEIGVPVTGLSTTSAVGAPSFVFSIDLTLTGVQATTELNDNLILKYFGKLTPKDSTGYATKTPKNSTGYTKKTA